ncbi:MAG: hypothetical protein AABZ39_07800 [Spirochaetota bacterium]
MEESVIAKVAIKKMRKAVVTGAAGGFLYGGLFVVYAFISIFNADFQYDTKTDIVGYFIIAALFFALSAGYLRNSRICGIYLFLAAFFNTAGIVSNHGIYLVTMLEIAFTVAILSGTPALFMIHKQRRIAGFVQRAMPVPLVALFSLMSIAGAVLFTYYKVKTEIGPNHVFISGTDLPPLYRNSIHDIRILAHGEGVLYLYSDAFLDFKDSFSFFTQYAVCHYAQRTTPPCRKIGYAEITNMEVFYSERASGASMLRVFLTNGSSADIPAPPGRGAIFFAEKMNEAWGVFRTNRKAIEIMLE